ncbi:MAG: hypothetical protein R6T96_01240 [Longimicrobiales bacterium]
MQNNEDIWYRMGFALESARNRGPATGRGRGRHRGKHRRTVPPAAVKRNAGSLDEASRQLMEAVLTVGAGPFLTRLLSLWPGSRRPGIFRMGKAAAAGAAAAFLTGLIRPLLSPAEASFLEEELTDALLSGAGRGLLYAAVVEPRVPGPGLLRGSIYGALEWALIPWGGLERLAGPAAPQGKIPLLSVLLQGDEEEELLQHLLFGMILALLYQD